MGHNHKPKGISLPWDKEMERVWLKGVWEVPSQKSSLEILI